MAIHPFVLVTADKRWRIEADEAGTVLTVWHDGLLIGRYTTLIEVQDLLRLHSLDLADLETG